MTEVTPWNYVYDFDTYRGNIYYFYTFDADDEDVINRYQWTNNELDYYKWTSWFTDWYRSWWTVRIDYREIENKLVDKLREEWFLEDKSDKVISIIKDELEAKINFLQDELNRKLTESDKTSQMKNRATQEKIDSLYKKLDELKPTSEPLERVRDYLEDKIEKYQEENKKIPVKLEEQIDKITKLSNMVWPMTIKQEKEFQRLIRKIEEEPEFKEMLLEEDDDFKKLIW